MSLRLVVTAQAEQNILANAEWWAENRSAEQTRRWLNEIKTQIRNLPNIAAMCSHARENGRPRFKYELWDKLFGLGLGNSHRVVFTIQSETIYVLAVRSTSQDDLTPASLPTLPPE